MRRALADVGMQAWSFQRLRQSVDFGSLLRQHLPHDVLIQRAFPYYVEVVAHRALWEVVRPELSDKARWYNLNWFWALLRLVRMLSREAGVDGAPSSVLKHPT